MKVNANKQVVTFSAIQADVFDAELIKRSLMASLDECESADISTLGSVVEFTGFVRADKVEDGQPLVTAIELEHYPAMTEKALSSIIDNAVSRFDCLAMALVHRVGRMTVGEPIVYVAVLSSHRKESFACAQFLMDYLKSEVPLWKREYFEHRSRWVDQKTSDVKAHSRWD